MNLLVTGATGFLGSRILSLAAIQDYKLSAIARDTKLSRVKSTHPEVKWHRGDFVYGFDWKEALVDVNCIVHCAARVHQMVEEQESLQLNYDETNFHATINFAKQAAQAGVERFIFISTIKVNGEETLNGSKFQIQVDEASNDPYGISKYKAEQALTALAKETSMEVVIIRPPLVYGPGVKGNFQSMIKWGCSHFPLPLGAINNKRSMVYIDNLVDLILTCTKHPNAANQILLVSDGQDVSVSEIFSQIIKVSKSYCILLPIPMSWFRIAAKITNKPKIAQRLCGSLQVDMIQTQQLLNWSPSITWEQGIERTVSYHITLSN